MQEALIEKVGASVASPRDGSHHGDSLERIGCFMGGVARDYRLRSKHAWTDYTYGLQWKTLSASLYMFFATFSSTVALGELIRRQTSNRIGITEYLLMNSVAGMAHALMGCQPLLVLRPTGPITAILLFISNLADSFEFDFFAYLSWTGIFVGIYMFLVSAFELCRWIKLLTRFTHDIFAFFVCTIYIHDGLQGIIQRFDPDKMVDLAGSFATCLSIVTFVMALWLHHARTWTSLTRKVRGFLSDYALTIAVAFTVLVSYTLLWGSSRISQRLGSLVERVHVPSGFRPTCGFNHTLTGSSIECADSSHARRWWVGLPFNGPGIELPLIAAATALPIVFFFFMDQNVSSLLTQRKAVGLSKGSYYHSSFLCMSVFNFIGPLFGLPFVTGSLPTQPSVSKGAVVAKAVQPSGAG